MLGCMGTETDLSRRSAGKYRAQEKKFPGPAVFHVRKTTGPALSRPR